MMRNIVLMTSERRGAAPTQGAGLTVQELADAAGLSRRMLTQIELGQANPSLVTLDRVARDRHYAYVNPGDEPTRFVRVVQLAQSMFGCDERSCIEGGGPGRLRTSDTRLRNPSSHLFPRRTSKFHSVLVACIVSLYTQQVIGELSRTRACRLRTRPSCVESCQRLTSPKGLGISIFLGSGRIRCRARLADHWSVWVNGNWRVTFRFIDGDVELVDYQDYH
jgi:proteic killer suppression protein